MAQKIVSFENPPRRMRPVAFWFLNHWLEDDEIIRQVDEMAAKGLGGFMLHPRDGLRTEYLSDTFAKRLETAVQEAARLGLSVWLYDELHFPSGPGGFRLPIDGHSMASLECVAQRDMKTGENLTCSADFACVTGGAGVQVLENGQRYVLPAAGKAFAFSVRPWKTPAGAYFFNYPDYTDPELTDEFLELVHEWYAAHLGKYFGTVIRGFFSDNSCGNFGVPRRAIPWGKDFPGRFQAVTGEALLPLLPGLFDRCAPNAAHARQLFWDFFTHAYLDNYFGRITPWCTRHDLLSTGHLACEDGLGEHLRQIGNPFEVQRHFTYCAVDDLGPEHPSDDLVNRPDDAGWLHTKLTASCARFLGRSEVMCECLGLASAPWRLSLQEMRRITGFLAVAGINVFVPHALFYSIAGHRKWECPPDHLHADAWKYYSRWTDWIARYSLAAIGGVNAAHVALLHPYATLKTELELGAPQAPGAASDRGKAIDHLEKIYRLAFNALFAHHVEFEIIDEELLGKATIVNDRLHVPSAHAAFSLEAECVILPAIEVLGTRSQELLRKFHAQGGAVIALETPCPGIPQGECPPVAASGDWSEPLTPAVKLSSPELFSRCWTNDGEFFCLVHNPTAKAITAALQLPSGRKYCRIDLEDGKATRWEDGVLVAAPAQMSLFTTWMPQAGVPAAVGKDLPVLPMPAQWRFTAEAPNLLPLRQWSLQAEGLMTTESFSFEAEFIPADLKLLLDVEKTKAELAAGEYGPRLEVLLNGHSVTKFAAGALVDHFIPEAAIAEWAQVGRNTLVIRRRAALLEQEYRTNPPMLAGSFALMGGHLAPLSPVSCGFGEAPGYPHYPWGRGYTCELSVPEAGGCLMPPIDHAVLTCCVEGQPFGLPQAAPPYRVELSGWAGKRIQITLRLAGTNQPLFG